MSLFGNERKRKSKKVRERKREQMNERGRKKHIVEDVCYYYYYCGGKPVKPAKFWRQRVVGRVYIIVCVRDKCRRKTEILYRQQYSRTMELPLLQIDQSLQ